MKLFCEWCSTPIKGTAYNLHYRKYKEPISLCSHGCISAEMLFREYYSDDEIYMRDWFNKGESNVST